ncbi:alanine acetyltransferase [Myroides marinus]|uniref:Alanine acetyltransferase n=1 Tax=Myroides marinus TaxID=703342 RepID=A0A165QKS4_9FLAO|nr:GNAT family N-acetyltransferase [Myroides marinus]KUF37904.1 alanine acetyltransferase [Myroides marinus]KZE75424.1 alanine acetyltransferase [Myroides marinus]
MKEKVLFFEVMTQEEALEIAYNWKYEGAMSFYNMTSDQEDLENFLDADARGQNTFSVRTKREKEMIAYFHYYLVDNNTAEIVLAINPHCLHRGYGSEIIEYVEEALSVRKGVKKLTVAVAEFNKTCINFYEMQGFRSAGAFNNYTNGGMYTFLKMEKGI